MKRVGNFPRPIRLLSVYISHRDVKHLSNTGYSRNNNVKVSDYWKSQKTSSKREDLLYKVILELSVHHKLIVAL